MCCPVLRPVRHWISEWIFFESAVGNANLHSATEAVLALAKVLRVTKDLVFVECRLIAECTGRELAKATATFMRMLQDAQSTGSALQQGNAGRDFNAVAEGAGGSIWDYCTREELSSVCATGVNDGGDASGSTIASTLTGSGKPESLSEILNGVAYAKMLGAELQPPEHSEALCQLVLPAEWRNVGNPQLPALHGGVIAGLMEVGGWLGGIQVLNSQAIRESGQSSAAAGAGSWVPPQLVDFSIDYLRSGRLQPLYLESRLIRLGRRITNVEILAWQADRQTPVAKARAHYLTNRA
jgi:acyl-coenzyme A thioesterase PaaI-like protein